MQKTHFYSGRNIFILLSEVKRGNEKAHDAIIAELTRLENRIRQIEDSVDKLPENLDPFPGEPEL